MSKPFKLTHNQVRYLLLPILALALVHFVSYKKLPYEAGYQFPWLPFVSVLLICLACCEANSLSYARLSKRWSLALDPFATILKQMGASLLLTTAVFAASVYTLNYVFFGHVAALSQFLSSLFVAQLIIAVETLVYIIRDFKRAQQAVQIQDQSMTWQYTSGKKVLLTPVQDIAYVYSQKGLVYIVNRLGEKHLTQFNSLNELSEENDTSSFFRLNRQFMVSAAAVSSIEKEVNQKLRVQLTPQSSAIPAEAVVSRYTSPEFKQWIKSA